MRAWGNETHKYGTFKTLSQFRINTEGLPDYIFLLKPRVKHNGHYVTERTL